MMMMILMFATNSVCRCYEGLLAGLRTAGGGWAAACCEVDEEEEEENMSRFFPSDPKADLISPIAKRPTSPAFFACGARLCEIGDVVGD